MTSNLTPGSSVEIVDPFTDAFVTLSLNAGVSARDVQHSAGHTDPRSTSYYDRKREDHTTNATHSLTAFVEGAD